MLRTTAFLFMASSTKIREWNPSERIHERATE